MKKIAFTFFVSLLLFSCEKDNQLIIENTDTPLISKVLIGDEIYMEYTYEYNANGYPIKVNGETEYVYK